MIDPDTQEMPDRASQHPSVGAMLLAFLQLGFTSFGGPVAHLGYFREAFVVRRGWIDDPATSEWE